MFQEEEKVNPVIEDLLKTQLNLKRLDKLFTDMDNHFPYEISKLIYNYLNCNDCKNCCSICRLHCFLNEDACIRGERDVCARYEFNSLNKKFNLLTIEVKKKKDD